MEIKVVYDKKVVNALQRSYDFCKQEGLKQIESIIFIGELLQESESRLYECFQEDLFDAETITETVGDCICEEADIIRTDEDFVESGHVLKFNYENESISFNISEDLWEVFVWLVEDQTQMSQQMLAECEMEVSTEVPLEILITVPLVEQYLVAYMPQQLTKFLRTLGMKCSVVKEYILGIKEVKEGTPGDIPKELESFLVDFTEKLDFKDKKLILGREKETEQLWTVISKRNKRNAVLVGEPGVGKTAIVYKLVQDIQNKECPKQYEDYRIISLDMAGLIAGTTYRGQAEKRFVMIKEFLENNPKVILFVDEIHTMLGAGACREGELDFANAMKPLLAGDQTTFIGATTIREYETYFAKDGALKRRFERINVKEPKCAEVYPMLKNRIKELEEYHGVKISKENAEFAIFTASCFDSETKNPDRTLDLLDKSMVLAKIHGKASVSKQTILSNFDINFKVFEKMRDADKEAVAYHEAGHFVVRHASKHLTEYNVVAVSIMPADDYLGINVFERNDETPLLSLEYYIDEMAADLAGRIAERWAYSYENAGASADLNSATKTAYRVVTKLGLINNDLLVYLKDEEMLSEKAKELINYRVKELLEKAENRAKKLLMENKELVDALVEELLKKKMLSEKELKSICETVEKK